jgi:hypothetical protein
MPPTQPQSGETDMQALALTHAIALAESGQNGKPNYNAVGDNGSSHGAYQWQPGNFSAAAKAAGLDPTDMSPENQDKVAYHEVKGYKDKGYDPGQIASLWNSGSPNNWQNHAGTTTVNGKPLAYDTPAYVAKVKAHYQELSGGQNNQVATPQGYNPTPFSGAGAIDFSGTNNLTTPETTPDNLGGDLSKRVSQGSEAATSGIQAALHGNLGGAASGALQTVGAAAGAVGDTVNRGLELIPGVKQVEGAIGKGVQGLMGTKTGQQVVGAAQDFSAKHSELAKDAGAAFNIVTALPILRGIGVAGRLGADAASQALKSTAEKSFINAAPEIIGSTKAGSRFITDNPNLAKDMVDRRLVGDIQGGKFSTKAAVNESWDTVKELNTKAKTILDQPEYANVGADGQSIAQKAIQGFTDRNGNLVEGLPNSGMTAQELIDTAKKLDPNNKLLWDKFEAGQANLKEINDLRSSLDAKVKKVFIGPTSLDAPEVAVAKENGALLSSAMRDAVQTAAPGTQEFFKEMTTQFKIQKALGYMDGKTVKPGGLAKLAGHAAGIGTGGTVGGMVGGPTGAFIGGMIGDRAAGAVANKLAGKNIVQGVLKKTGANATRTSAKSATNKLSGLVAGATAQKANRP